MGGALVPDTDDDADKLRRWKDGEVAKVQITKPRNYHFLKKFMALIGIGFDAFSPTAGVKNKDQFRSDVTILAGYYEQHVRLDGSIRTVAKSISFAKMEEDEFEKLYSSVIDVMLQRVLTKYSRDDLDDVVNKILGFC
jgi:hypothetical protein